MSLTKRGNIWHVHFFTPDGQRIRESTGTSDKRKAQEYHDRLKTKYWRSEVLGDQTERTWKEAVVKFLAETEHKASRRDDLQKLRWLDQHFGDLTLAQVTRDRVSDIGALKRKKTTVSTANRYLALIRSVLRKASLEWEWIDKAPKVRLYPEPSRRVRWLTSEEATRLLQELPEHLASMVEFILATGLRDSNVTGLEWSQIDMQ
ncbi:MAG: tyrosine-type recombinase/integrase, partial [Magnetococcales bacterium]|nr:tyrosine-type recombinase/integrase [Magnetococcales bacterium]